MTLGVAARYRGGVANVFRVDGPGAVELRRIGIVMNSVTGAHGLPPAPRPLDPRPSRAGAASTSATAPCCGRRGPDPRRSQREQALKALAERHGLERWTATSTRSSPANPTVEIYFDAQVAWAREEAIKKAITARKAHLHRRSRRRRAWRRRPGAGPGAPTPRVHRTPCRPGQDVPAGPAGSSSASSTAASSAAICPYGASSATGSSRGLAGAERPAGNCRAAEDGGGIVLDMCPHWGTYCASCSAGERSDRPRRHAHPAALGRAGKPYDATADDAAYASSSSKAAPSPRSTPPGPYASTATNSSSSRSTARRLGRRGPAQLPVQHRRATPAPSGTPTSPP